MSEIRVTYSGLISFILGIISILTGFIFTVIITRTLLPEEFGTWGVINNIIFYVVLLEPIISYWTTRKIARGINVGKTSLFSNSAFSVLGIFVFLILSFFISESSSIDFDILIFSLMLIPVMFVNKTLNAITLGWKPHFVSVGVITYGISQIVFSLILVYHLNYGLTGLIISVFFAFLTSNMFLIFSSRKKLRGSFHIDFLKKCLKLFWIPTFPSISLILSNSTVIVFLLIIDSVYAIGIWSAALVISSLIGNSQLISNAVYPKLLSAKNREFFEQNMSLLFFISIMFTAIVIVFAKPGLYILNPIYVTAVPIVIITSLMTFFRTISEVFQMSLIGIEQIDLNENSTFRQYVKSKLFKIPVIRIIQDSLIIGILISGLFLLHDHYDENALLNFWAYVLLIIQIPFFIYFYNQIRTNFIFKINTKSILKYFVTAFIIFGLIFILQQNIFDYEKSLFPFLFDLIPLIVISVILYLSINYFIDKRISTLIKSIIAELKNRN